MSSNAKRDVIAYWLKKSSEAIEGAKRDFDDKRYSFAVSRAYYACFYALSAVLLKEEQKYSKHSAVRSALHRLFVKTGKISIKLGRLYDLLFDSRQRADYQDLVTFQQEEAEELLSGAVTFVNRIKELSQKGEF